VCGGGGSAGVLCKTQPAHAKSAAMLWCVCTQDGVIRVADLWTGSINIAGDSCTQRMQCCVACR
jgi:hypothetical protein